MAHRAGGAASPALDAGVKFFPVGQAGDRVSELPIQFRLILDQTVDVFSQIRQMIWRQIARFHNSAAPFLYPAASPKGRRSAERKKLFFWMRNEREDFLRILKE
jgi:hypothetical protein